MRERGRDREKERGTCSWKEGESRRERDTQRVRDKRCAKINYTV